MHTQVYDPSAPKKPVNLNANSDLIKTAKDIGVNLSQIFEEAVLATVKLRLEQQWLQENKAAINDYNSHIEEHGVFAAEKRSF
jgi:antitoxin CcdA